MRSSRLSLAAAGFVLVAASVAHADTFTIYDMNSTFSSGGTITGTMTLDDTTSAWSAANLTAANFDTSNELYTLVTNIGDDGVFIGTTAESFPDIFFDTVNPFSTYVGQSSIPLDALQFNSDEDSQTAVSASLTVSKSLGAPPQFLSLRASL
jgi:hypothetical protein